MARNVGRCQLANRFAKQTMQGFALWGLVVELKRDNAPNHEPSHSTGYFDEMIAAATMAANEQPRTLH
jgi:hypothetical protein